MYAWVMLLLFSPVLPSKHLSHLWVCPAGQLAAGTCEIVTLDRDSSQPRRTIARQTARCACKKGQIAGTTNARPACVDGKIIFKETYQSMQFINLSRTFLPYCLPDMLMFISI